MKTGSPEMALPADYGLDRGMILVTQVDQRGCTLALQKKERVGDRELGNSEDGDSYPRGNRGSHPPRVKGVRTHDKHLLSI